jgi:hypothetical protein
MTLTKREQSIVRAAIILFKKNEKNGGSLPDYEMLVAPDPLSCDDMRKIRALVQELAYLKDNKNDEKAQSIRSGIDTHLCLLFARA